jgi:hypothetical protein
MEAFYRKIIAKESEAMQIDLDDEKKPNTADGKKKKELKKDESDMIDYKTALLSTLTKELEVGSALWDWGVDHSDCDSLGW